MVKHIVMWKFKEFAQGRTKEENLELVRSMLLKLPEKIDFIRSMEVRFNENPKEGMFDAVLISTFDSPADVERYRVHPEHKAVSSYVSLVREDRASVDFTE